ncbi:carbohydrate kinase [Marinilabiliaceae bacterium JC017]|nr:carbohydrate kinase [Marinilabiliaceae bacterium JC017]
MYSLGFDIGSSSVKVGLLNLETGLSAGTAFYPKEEMGITALHPSWAEQAPEDWWQHLKMALQEVMSQSGISPESIKAIGISYQMHGLVAIDKAQKVLRPSIIWCDSRAVTIGEEAFRALGETRCLASLLNSPGNFTASKLKWVKDNEPDLYEKISKIMLPGDYIAMRLTGETTTTVSGLSEGIFWDYKNQCVSKELMDYYGFDTNIIPSVKETFSIQGELTVQVAAELGLVPGIPVSYRAGDQPNNALSLNVLNPGEVAATAGTSGVVYGISDQLKYDPLSRVNTFAHVNHHNEQPRLGVLLCINGTGILNSWIRKTIAPDLSYEQMNEAAHLIPPGSDGLHIYPFGNGAERVLENRNPGAEIKNLHFNRHGRGHIIRAAQEGIAFSFKYGMDVMEQTGIETKVIRAGKANMFLSPIFRQTLADISGSIIELYETDGAMGAARGAAVGAGLYASFEEAFASLKKAETIEPDLKVASQLQADYDLWKQHIIK